MGCGCKCGNNTCSWIYDCCCCPTCPPCGCVSTTSGETCLNGVTYYLYNTEYYYSFKFSEVIFVPDGSSQSTNECIEQFMKTYYDVGSGYTFSNSEPTSITSLTCENSTCQSQAKGSYMWQSAVGTSDDIFTCQDSIECTCATPDYECIYS